MKLNDWIVANLSNPDLTPLDFHDALGMSLDNTLLLSEDEYLKSDYITNNPKFEGKDGQFNKQIFDNYYLQAASTYSSFDDSNNSILTNFLFDPFDTAAKANSRIKPVSLHFEEISNPDLQTIGIVGINQYGDALKTPMEIAQTLKIFDGAKFLLETPNDSALTTSIKGWVSSLFLDPLVMATYDEDTDAIDPLSGLKVHHKKGEYKLNDEGTYYLEKLNGRPITGKLVMSHFDTITVDGKGANAIDFFDSDSADKSVTGTIVKTAVTIAPLFIAPELATVYSGLLVGKELVKALPDLCNIVGGITGLVTGNTKFNVPVLNTLAGVAASYSQGTTPYSQAHAFSMENMGNMIADVALIWGQQKVIGLAIEKINGVLKEISEAKDVAKVAYDSDRAEITSAYAEKIKKLEEIPEAERTTEQATELTKLNLELQEALNPFGMSDQWEESPIGLKYLQEKMPNLANKVLSLLATGANAGLAYMSITANTDVYNQLKEHGASDSAAALTALGSMLGMFSVDKFLGIGQLFTKDFSKLNPISTSLNEATSNIQDLLGANNTVSDDAASFIMGGYKHGKDAVKTFFKKMKDHNITTDVGKAMGGGLERISEQVSTDVAKSIYQVASSTFNLQGDHNVGAFSDMGSRYGMAFVTGIVGSGIFSVADRIKGIKPVIDDANNELSYQVTMGRTNDLLDDLETKYKDGKCASTTLSATKKTKDGVWLTATDASDSQNTFVYKQLKNIILLLDTIINGDVKIGKTKDELYELMLLKNIRYMKLKDYLQDASYETGYINDYMNLVNKYVNLSNKINTIDKYTLDGTKFMVSGDESITIPTDEELRHTTEELKKAKQVAIDNIKQEKAKVLQLITDFQSGKASIPYVQKMQFLIDERLYQPFLNLTFEEYIKDKYKKSIKDLSLTELESYKEEYDDYAKSMLESLRDSAFNQYKAIEEKIAPELLNIVEQFKANEVLKLFDVKVNYDDRFATETDDEYNNRNNLTDEEKSYRTGLLQYTKLLDNLNNVTGIDSTTQRQLILLLNNRESDIRKWKIALELKDHGLFASDTLANDSKKYNGIHGSSIEDFNDTINSLILDYDGSKNSRNLIASKVISLLPEVYRDYLVNPYNGELNKLASLLSPPIGETDLAVINNLNNDIGKSFAESKDEYYKNISIKDWGEFAFEKFLKPQEDYPDDYPIEGEPVSNNHILKTTSTSIIKEVNAKLDKIDNALKNDVIIKTFEAIREKANKINYANNLLKNYAIKIGDKTTDIESLLAHLLDAYLGNKRANQFTLSAEGIDYEDLDRVDKYIDLVCAYISAASTQPTLFSPLGHNWSINDLIENHQDVLSGEKPLPVLDKATADIYLYDLALYKYEIEAWKLLSKKNEINKEQQHIDTSNAITKADINTLNLLKENLIFTVDGKTIDLAENIGNVTDRKSVMLAQLTLYNNFVKSGLKLTDLLGKDSPILKLITNSEGKKLQSFLNLTVSKYGVELEDYTPYDKVINLLTYLTMSPKDFYEYQLKFIEKHNNIAPFPAQLALERIILGRIKGGKAYAEVMEKLSKNAKTDYVNLSNFIFVNALGGAGKSSVVAKAIIEYLPTDTKTLLITPEQTQLDNLKSSTGVDDGMLVKDVITKLVGDDKYKENAFRTVTFSSGRDWHVAKPELAEKMGSLTETPKLIVIDEVTNLDAYELQVLDTYAKKNDITIIALGNSNQSGLMESIDKFNEFFTLRTPKLTISVRDNNVLKLDNASKVAALEDILDNEDDAELLRKRLPGLVADLKLRAYVGANDINGDLFVNDLSEVNGKLSGSVCYVGDKDSPDIVELKNNNKGITNFTVLSPSEIQGLEFDYVVVNSNLARVLTLDLSIQFAEAVDGAYYTFLKKLYTMITRSRTATIFKDPSLEMITGKNTIDLYKNKNNDEIFKKAIANFIGSENKFIEDILPELTYEAEPEPKEEKKDWITSDDFKKIDPPPTDLGTDTGTIGDVIPSDSNSISVFPDFNLKRVSIDYKISPVKSDARKAISNFINETTLNKQCVEFDSTNIDQYRDIIKLANILFDSTAIRTLDEAGDNLLELLEKSHITSSYGLLKYFRKYYFDWVKYNRSTWIRNITEENGQRVLEDLNITLLGDTQEPEKKLEAVKKLMEIKSAILYNNKNLFGDITHTDANKLKYYLEIREPDNNLDTFYGLTGLKNVETTNKKIYTVVAEYEDVNGDKCRITLGAVSKKDIVNIKNIPIVDKTSGKFDITKYINFSGTTNLEKRDNNVILTLEEFKRQNPYLVVSLVYIDNDNTKVDDNGNLTSKTKGLPCVFVSRDLNIPAEKLVDIYNTQNDDLRVRKVILGNLGVSMYDIHYQLPLIELSSGAVFRPNISMTNLHAKATYLGLRMYQSMWNFRADLMKFTSAFLDYFGKDSTSGKKFDELYEAIKNDDAFKKLDLSLKDSKFDFIDELSKWIAGDKNYRDYLKNGKLSDTQFDLILSKYGDAIKLINEFNKKVKEEAGLFLLNTPVTKDSIIIKVNTKENPYNAIGVSFKYANACQTILDKVVDSLNKYNLLKLTKENGEDFPKNVRLSSKEGAVPFRLTNAIGSHFSLTLNNGTDLAETVNVESVNDSFKYIPVILSGLYSKESRNAISYKLDSKSYTYDDFDEQYKLTSEEDDLFPKLCDLMFHGTTADYRLNYVNKYRGSKSVNVPQARGAAFPRGIMLDSDHDLTLTDKVLNYMLLDENGKLINQYLVDVGVGFPYFYISSTKNEAEQTKVEPTQAPVTQISELDKFKEYFNENANFTSGQNTVIDDTYLGGLQEYIKTGNGGLDIDVKDCQATVKVNSAGNKILTLNYKNKVVKITIYNSNIPMDIDTIETNAILEQPNNNAGTLVDIGQNKVESDNTMSEELVASFNNFKNEVNKTEELVGKDTILTTLDIGNNFNSDSVITALLNFSGKLNELFKVDKWDATSSIPKNIETLEGHLDELMKELNKNDTCNKS